MMWCPNYACKLTVAACQLNQRIAVETSGAILRGEETVFSLPVHHINRMLVCGFCDKSMADPNKSRAAFRRSFSVLADTVERYSEWGPDPEVARAKAFLRGREWRQNNRDRTQDKQITTRIEELRRITDDGNINIGS